jgi:protein-disulfide isomerase
MTALAGYRQIRPPPANTSAPDAPPSQVSNWEQLVNDRSATGPTDALVKIVEFADFECPVCRTYDAVLDSIRTRYPDDVSVYFAHYPLSYHRFAMPSARAAECASMQARFDAMRHELFKHQDSLGLKSWESFAADAGVPDAAAFSSCMAATAPIGAVTRDTALGHAIRLRGTPTLVVNGWMWASPPSLDVLDSIVRAEQNSRGR